MECIEHTRSCSLACWRQRRVGSHRWTRNCCSCRMTHRWLCYRAPSRGSVVPALRCVHGSRACSSFELLIPVSVASPTAVGLSRAAHPTPDAFDPRCDGGAGARDRTVGGIQVFVMRAQAAPHWCGRWSLRLERTCSRTAWRSFRDRRAVGAQWCRSQRSEWCVGGGYARCTHVAPVPTSAPVARAVKLDSLSATAFSCAWCNATRTCMDLYVSSCDGKSLHESSPLCANEIARPAGLEAAAQPGLWISLSILVVMGGFGGAGQPSARTSASRHRLARNTDFIAARY